MRFGSWMTTVVCGLLLVACGGGENEGPAKSNAGSAKSNEVEACSILTRELIARVFDVNVDTVEDSSSGFGGKKYCSYRWAKENAEEIEAENNKRMQEQLSNQMQAVKEGKPATIIKFLSNQYEVSLTTMPFDDSEMAARAFDANIQRMREGVTGEHKGYKATFKIDYNREVPNVGAKSAWSTDKHQMVTQHKNYLLHLSVNMSENDDENLEAAKKLAVEITKVMR